MDTENRLAVNVVTWNSMAYVPYLTASLENQDISGFTVTIVDNASNDGVVSWVQTNRPDITVLRNFRNQGMAKAYNQAIALARSHWSVDTLEQRYIMISSPSVEFAPNALRLMMAYMDAHPDVAACGPKRLRASLDGVYDEERREMVHTTIIDSTGLECRKTRRIRERGAGEEDRGQYDDTIEIFGCSRPCVLFRASALFDAMSQDELYDEDFFEHEEDIDLAWRMRRLGYTTHYIPQAIVWHHPQGASSLARFFSVRNHLWLRIKNDELLNALLHAPWWVFYDFGSWITNLFSWSRFKGQWAALAGIPRMLRKRYTLSKQARVSGIHIRQWFI